MKNAVKSYSYEKVAPLDSGLYYTLRKLTLKQRDAVVAIHAFYREMETVLFECHELELALIKLNWWRGEVAKLTEGQPDHPVMILLKSNADDLLKIQTRLLKIIDGFEQNSIAKDFATFEDVVVQWMRTAGEREWLLHEILNEKETISAELLYQLMLIIEIVNFVQYLRLYIRHDVMYFSNDELQKCNVTHNMLAESITTDAIKKLLQHQVEKVERAYAEMQKFTRQQRKLFSHLVIRCEMAYQTLREIEKSDFCVLENLIKLTPVRYWWIVFRL